MRRCLILIGNEGVRNTNTFLPGVRPDIDRYNAFFRSDYGGAWEDEEIEDQTFGWTIEGLSSALRCRRASRLDYALIVFAGHGYAERDGEVYFELSPGQEITLSEIKKYLTAQKMLMIADSCQGYLDRPLAGLLNESIRIFSEGGLIMRSRTELRNKYNNLIELMSCGSKVFASAVSPGEYANDTARGGLYSRALMDTAGRIIETVPGHRYVLMDVINESASEVVVRESFGRQHPHLTMDKDGVFPPFLVI